jgi:heme exporter protein D
MTWSSASDFFAMGGYALYVWGAYAVCLALMLIEPLVARRQKQQAFREARRPSGEHRDD